MQALVGIDIGTSATKVVIVDQNGHVLASASVAHTLLTPKPGYSEQDPVEWWSATCSAIRKAAAEAPQAQIIGVGLSGQMHGSVFLDGSALGTQAEHALPIRNALLWNDQRTGPQCDQIHARVGSRQALVRAVGNAAIPGFTIPKLLWVREHEPNLAERIRMVLLPKDYIRLRLTGQCATDVGDASGMLVLDVAHRKWSKQVCDALDIDMAILPDVLESAEVAGRITRAAAQATGLPQGTPVVAGTGDNMAAAIGAGVVAPGVAGLSLGTSGVIIAPSAAPVTDDAGATCGRTHTMCSATGNARSPGNWVITGCMLSAAGSLGWARSSLFPEASIETLLDEAALEPVGSRGLVFLPHLTGERCPHPDPHARGAWIGLTSRHSRGCMTRSILEGVALTMGQVLDLVVELGIPVDRMRLSGGGAASPLWRSITASALGVPVEKTSSTDGPAFGAALLASVGIGVHDDIQSACRQTIAVRETIMPDPVVQERLQSLAAVYQGLYPALEESMHALGQFDA